MKALKSLARQLLVGVAPQTTTALLCARARAHSQTLVAQWGLIGLDDRLIAEIGSRVVSGPFRGLQLTPQTRHEHIGPFLLGTYERELHPWWDFILKRLYEQVIDVGAQFGYYAVGLALKFPRAEVVAFDTDRWARGVLKEMALANRVENLSIKGYCTPQWLDSHVRPAALILSDCEGYERQLFGRIRPDVLATSTVIIEAHEHLEPGVTASIESRFAATHAISRVASRTVDEAVVEIPIHSLDREEIRKVSAELRMPCEWLLLEPKPA